MPSPYVHPDDGFQRYYVDDGHYLRVHDISGASGGGGAGSQYLEQSTSTSIVGTVAMGESSDKLLPLQLTTGSFLKVSLENSTVSIGGGIQYGESGSVPVATGTMMFWRKDPLTVHPVSPTSPLPVQGPLPAGSLASLVNPTLIAGRNISNGQIRAIDSFNGGFEALIVLNADTSAHAQTFGATGETYAWPASTDNTAANARYIKSDSSGNIGVSGTLLQVYVPSGSITNAAGTAMIGSVVITDGNNSITVDGTVTANQGGTWNIGTLTSITNPVTVSGTLLQAYIPSGLVGLTAGTSMIGSVVATGDTAHDNVDAGNPLKIGGKAIDMQPDSAGPQGPSAVAANDRVNGLFDLFGRRIEVPNSAYFQLSGLEVLFNDTTTTASTGVIDVWPYRQATIGFVMHQSGAPTDITFSVHASLEGSIYHKMDNGFLSSWVYDDTALGGNGSPYSRSLTFPIAASKLKVSGLATGTTATKIFSIGSAYLYLRN